MLRARVRARPGLTSHTIARRDADGGLNTATLPTATFVKIVGQPGSFYLLRYSDDREFCGNIWHATVEEAKAQAEFEYDIRDEDWTTGELSSGQESQ